MISSSIPKFVHNRGHGFSKRLYPAGVYYFNHQYRPAPCLIISPRPGRMAERARSQPLPRMSLTRGSLVKLETRFSVYFNTLACGHRLHTPSSLSSFHRHAHANGKLQTKGPWATPSQVGQSMENPIRPTDGSTLGLGERRKELAPRGKNEANNHHATMATHSSLLANVKYLGHLLNTIHHHHHHNHNHRTQAKLLSRTKHK